MNEFLQNELLKNEFSPDELNSLICELPDEIVKYKLCGDFAGAFATIGRWLNRPVPELLKTRLRLEQRILAQLPQQFPYTAAQAIDLFQNEVSDFSQTDLERLDRAGLAEWIFYDGEKHYIHNLIRNALQKDREIRRRAGVSEVESDQKKLLKETIAKQRQDGQSSWRFRLRTTIRVRDEVFQRGMYLKAHLPVPAVHHQTSEVRILDYYRGKDAKVTIDPENSLYRAVCFETTAQTYEPFFVEYEYTVTAPYHDFSEEDRLRSEKTFVREDNVCEQYTGEQHPHIRFTPYLRALAAEIAGTETEPLSIARRIYDYITKNVNYSYMREYFLIEDIPQYCARNLRGDCGVQALLFITLCRICGIPAKWQSGLYAIPGQVGPHDWAMFYVEPYGWLYADPSFGGSAFCDGDEARRIFYFGNLDPFRMAANHAFQQPFAAAKRFLPIDPYDNQSGEIESSERGFGNAEVENTKILLDAWRLTP